MGDVLNEMVEGAIELNETTGGMSRQEIIDIAEAQAEEASDNVAELFN